MIVKWTILPQKILYLILNFHEILLPLSQHILFPCSFLPKCSSEISVTKASGCSCCCWLIPRQVVGKGEVFKLWYPARFIWKGTREKVRWTSTYFLSSSLGSQDVTPHNKESLVLRHTQFSWKRTSEKQRSSYRVKPLVIQDSGMSGPCTGVADD